MNLLLNTPPLTVFEQMALDEILVKHRPKEITLRFYNWAYGPAVTYGYAQFFNEVNRQLSEKHFTGDFTRRPTGGGIVFHQDDLTFSLIFQHNGKPAEIYKNLHCFIQAELEKSAEKPLLLNGIVDTNAYRPSLKNSASACFSNPVENDILADDGTKILGGALRRFGTTVLYQGSLQVPDGRYNPVYKQAVTLAVRCFLGVQLHVRAVEKDLLLEACRLAQTQYKIKSWKEKF